MLAALCIKDYVCPSPSREWKRRMASLILRGGTVFDGERVRERTDVAIVDGRVSAVGPDLPKIEGAQDIDATGRFVMPGLIDAHTHLALAPVPERKGDHPSAFFTAVRQARIKLASGCTTVRDVGGINHIDIELKKAIRRGDTPGPRMLCAGRFIATTGGHCHYFAEESDGPTAVRAAARAQLKAGADLVKIMVSGGVANVSEPPERLYMDADEVAAAAQVAHAAGRRLAAHIHPAKGITMAVRHGVDTVEHGAWIDEEAIDAMLETGAALIPTEAVYHYMAAANDPHYAQLAPVAQRVTKEKSARLKHAVARGVRIGVGTDCGRHFPYDAFAEELVHLGRAGMRSEAVLAAATAGNAEIIGLGDRVGRLAAGFAGDAVVLDGNPIEDLAAARAVRLVIQGGVALAPAAILGCGAVI